MFIIKTNLIATPRLRTWRYLYVLCDRRLFTNEKLEELFLLIATFSCRLNCLLTALNQTLQGKIRMYYHYNSHHVIGSKPEAQISYITGKLRTNVRCCWDPIPICLKCHCCIYFKHMCKLRQLSICKVFVQLEIVSVSTFLHISKSEILLSYYYYCAQIKRILNVLSKEIWWKKKSWY